MNLMQGYNQRTNAAILLSRIGWLFFCMFIMLFVVTGLAGLLTGASVSSRTSILTTSAWQDLFVFIVPSVIVAWTTSRQPLRYLGCDTPVSLSQFAGAAILMVLAMPCMNYIIDWNANMQLPQSWNELGRIMREWENAAAATTEILLSATSAGGLISGILIIGCLTGIAEEFFFRGGIQKALTSAGVNRHVAIWTTAVIFSAVHLQFFGFVPRVLLGAFFGYLYYSSDSIWVAAFAHSFNNSVAVLSSWLVSNNWIVSDFDKLGVQQESFPWLAISSVFASALFIYYFWKPLFHHKRNY